MKRLAAAAHVLAIPIALVLAALVCALLPTGASERAVETALHDTYFVVAHFHPSVVLACLVLVLSVVGHRYRSETMLLRVAQGMFVFHLIAAVVAWRVSLDVSAEPGASVLVQPPDYPSSAYFYLGSAVAGLVAAGAALVASLVRAMTSAAPATKT